MEQEAFNSTGVSLKLFYSDTKNILFNEMKMTLLFVYILLLIFMQNIEIYAFNIKSLIRPHMILKTVNKRSHTLKMTIDTSSTPFPSSSSSLNILMDKATGLFPAWVVAASFNGAINPSTLTWFTPYITPALSITMIAMGMTLSTNDFKRISDNPTNVIVGILCQYTIMPLLAYSSAKFFALPPDLASGLILVGCAPGGTASNLCTLIANADVALSVLMTAASTCLAIFATPFLTSQLAGGLVKINSMDLVISTLQVVLLPVLLGFVINSKAPSISEKVSKYTPFLCVILVALICGSISATNAAASITSVVAVPLLRVIGAITTLHSGGFLLGYTTAKLLKSTEAASRTISIETGMQNSALAAVLANHFPNPTLTALPGCISATVHSCIGSLLAAIWRNKPLKEEKV